MKLLCCGTARTKSRHRLRAKHTTRENGSCLRARAVKDYSKSKDRTHLSFREGDIIIVTEQNSNGLWKGVRYGSYKGRPGYFPASAVVLAESESSDQNSERQQCVLTSQSTVEAYRSLAVRLSTAAAADGVVGSGISPGGGSQCSGASAYQLSCQACSGALTLTEHRLSGQSCESGVSTSSSRHSCHSARSGGGIIGGGVVPSGSGSLVTGTGSATDPSSSNGSSSSSSRGSINRLEESGYSSTVNVHELMMQGLTDSEVLQSWLNGLHLEEYYCLFAEAGYDMPTISRMTPEDLTAIGVAKPSVRKVLKTEIGRLTIRDGIPDYKPETVDEWLESLHLSQYTETLQQQGYTDINRITEITWEDLEDIGIKKLGHQKKMMLAIDRLRRMDAGQHRLSGAQTSTSSSSTSTKLSSGLSSAVVVSAFHESTVSSSAAAARSTTAVVHPPSLSTMSSRTVHHQPLPPVAEASPLIPRQVASVGTASLSARTCYLSSVSQPLQQPLIAVTSSSSVVPVEFNKFHQQLQQHNYQQPKSLHQQQQQQRCVNTAAPLNSSSISTVSLAKSSALSSAMTSSTPPATVATSLQCHRSQPQLPRDIECVAAPSQSDRFPSASMVPQTLIGKDNQAEAACLEQAAGQSSDQLTSGGQRSMITTTMVSSKAPQQQQLLSFSSTPTLNTTSSCSLSSHVTPLTRLSTTSALKQTTIRPPVQYVVGSSNNFKVIVGSDWLPADNLDGNGGVQASSTPKRLGVEPTLSCFRPPSVNDDSAKVSCGTLPRSKPSQMQCIAVGSQSNIRGQQTLVPAIKSTSPSLSYLDRCQSFPVAPACIETAYRKEPPVPPVRTHSFKADIGPTRYSSKGVNSDGGGFVGGRVEGVSSADSTKIRDSESQLFVFHDTGPVLQLSLPQNSSRATPSKLNQRCLASCSSSGDLLNDVIEQLERRDVAVCSAPISAATATMPRTTVAVSTFNSGPLQTAKQSQQRLGDWQDSQPTSSSDSGSEDSDSGLESRLTESTSSLPIAIDTNTLPFANENVGTIKQRGQSTSSSASIKSSASTSTTASSCSTSPLATTPGVQVTNSHKSSSNDDWPTTAACTAGHDGKPRSFLTVESEAVFNDIDGMLMGLTAELDEMLKTAVLN